jgi:hypothetical protein
MFTIFENRLLFKSQIATRGFLSEDGIFTPTETKLLRLGLDPAAHEGEIDNCAVKLVRSWRKRGLTPEQIVASFAQKTQALRDLSAARGYVVSFGKYRGRTVGEVPKWYLKWALQNCRDLSFNERKAMQLIYDQGQRK